MLKLSDLTSDGQKLMRYFHDRRLGQGAYELPGILAEQFGDPERCEAAEHELADLDLIDLAPLPKTHAPMQNRICAAALTLDGERFVQRSFAE